MIIDIRFFSAEPLQIQNVRRVSVYPHIGDYGASPVVVVYHKDDRVTPRYFDMDKVKDFWMTND